MVRQYNTESTAPRIAVLGSLNIDLVIRAPRFPAPGETLAAETFQTYIGGKGFNQAIAAARLGAQVKMIGRVGGDEFGLTLRAVAVREGIATDALLTTSGVSSGVASIVVDAKAENCILLVAGANGRVSAADVDSSKVAITGAHALLTQLEIPQAAVARGLMVARQAGVLTVLVPAPARLLSAELLAHVEVIVANREEISAILPEATHDPELDARRALKAGPRLVIVTLGNRGALAVEADKPTVQVPAFPIKAVDTTGAGDAFAAGLAVALAERQPLPEALRWAAACGALACTVQGAEPSLPRREAVQRLVRG